MQRRGKLAHISPPRSSSMGSNDKLARRGLTNRLWLVVCAVLALFAFVHYVVPSFGGGATAATYSNSDLKPKNYMNASMEEAPNPFDFCPVYGPGDEVAARHGALALSKTRMHLGSGARIQRVLHRALAGQPVTISVLGGSVSACHGAGDDPISPRCWPSKFFQWWNSVFPHPASELTNGAMRRVNAEYFGFCSAHHLPDVTDLVIIELDADDGTTNDFKTHFETLVRSILIRPDQPAVLLLGHWSAHTHALHGFAGPDHMHDIVAQFYDIPHVSIKALLYPDYMREPTSIQKYFVDPMLANNLGHDLISDVLISYFQAQICNAWSVFTGSAFDSVAGNKEATSGNGAAGLFAGLGQRKGVPEPGAPKDAKDEVDAEGNLIDVDLDMDRSPDAGAAGAHLNAPSVPQAMIDTRPDTARDFEEVDPFCASANDLVNPLPPSLFYGSGWNAFHPPGGATSLTAKSHYWYSSLPTSKLRIPIHVGKGDIGVYYLQEPTSAIGEGSAVECWVDDNYAGAKMIENAADIGEERATLFMIDHWVSRGAHFVECALMGDEGTSVPPFKIIGVFST
ncbi:hypothetical protein BD626DRAFT_397026 [Schizophyllum amplum]|uniref:Capsular associated protein n=1 Tax=Schizophyllum amplum TaxID=97359 RepID=A0A550CR04_9AGAR|nr:hypothetical protein BD626DRAFT_397026 [Auriculariopsis ampla]